MNRKLSTPATGFTLLELLVVLALLSLLMLGTLSALRGTAQVETRVDQRIERADDLRLLHTFLTQLTCCVMAERRRALNADQAPLYFDGEPDRVAWVGLLPGRVGLGGQYFFDLRVEALGQGAAGLVLRYVPFDGGTEWPDWGVSEQRTLQTDVDAMELRYEDIRDPAGWVDHWTDGQNLPARVELQLVSKAAPWPPMRFSLRALPRRSALDGDFGVGGSAQ